MDNEIIQAHFWEKIIHLAFSPSSDSEKKGWVECYIRSIPKFWEIDGYPTNKPGLSGNIQNSPLGISYDYSIENINKYAVTFMYNSQTQGDIMWSHDVDHNYYVIPINKLMPKPDKKSSAFKKIDKKLLEGVLDGLIFHPMVHQHLLYPIDNHLIRIGGGIANPFLFLFQIRYQFCLIEENRNKEKERLMLLFSEAIRAKSVSISAGKLFNL